MIGHLKGTLAARRPTQIVIDCTGVGYELVIPMSTFDKLPAVGESVHLYTRLVVREDSQTLYGFSDTRQRRLFDQLIGVSGIGPKLALAVLSGIGAADFQLAVSRGDAGLLTGIPGVGQKTAERMVLELKDKLGDAVSLETVAEGGAATSGGAVTEAVAALVALGFSRNEASAAVTRAAKGGNGDAGSSELIRRALAGRRVGV